MIAKIKNVHIIIKRNTTRERETTERERETPFFFFFFFFFFLITFPPPFRLRPRAFPFLPQQPSRANIFGKNRKRKSARRGAACRVEGGGVFRRGRREEEVGVSRKQKRSFSLLLLSRAAFIFFSFVFLNPGMKKKKKRSPGTTHVPPLSRNHHSYSAVKTFFTDAGRSSLVLLQREKVHSDVSLKRKKKTRKKNFLKIKKSKELCFSLSLHSLSQSTATPLRTHLLFSSSASLPPPPPPIRSDTEPTSVSAVRLRTR